MRLKFTRGYWTVYWRENGTQRRISLRTADRSVAEQRLIDFQRAKAQQDIGENVEGIVTAYLADKKDRARSYKSMVTAWRALQPYFAHVRPDQISRDMCRTYTDERRKGGVKNGTIIKDLGVLKAALRWAGRTDGAVFDMPPTPPPRDVYLTRAEFSRLMDACELPHIKLFILLALSTAGRASALLELTWDRVDMERGQIRLSAGERGRKGRATVPMTKSVRTALEAAAKARESHYVIEWSGQRVKSVKRAFATACRNAGLSGISPHVMRHTAAVWMAEDGIGMEEIAQFLGHSDPRVTYRVYARFSPNYLRKAATALEI